MTVESASPSEKKAQKKPHGSFEVECGGGEHNVDVVSENTFVEVPCETVVRFQVADDRFYSSALAEQVVLLSPLVVAIRGFWRVRDHHLRRSQHLLPPVAAVSRQHLQPPSRKSLHLLQGGVDGVAVIFVAERHRPDNQAPCRADNGDLVAELVFLSP